MTINANGLNGDTKRKEILTYTQDNEAVDTRIDESIERKIANELPNYKIFSKYGWNSSRDLLSVNFLQNYIFFIRFFLISVFFMQITLV